MSALTHLAASFSLATKKDYAENFITLSDMKLVPLARLERALPKKMDFESIASTNSATGARASVYGEDHDASSDYGVVDDFALSQRHILLVEVS